MTFGDGQVQRVGVGHTHRPEHFGERLTTDQALHGIDTPERDLGLLPEGEMHRLSSGGSPYDFARGSAKFDFAKLYLTADVASSLAPDSTPALIAALHDADSGVRYWAVLGCLMRATLDGGHAQKPPHFDLVKLLDDPAPDVRIAAAETLVRFGGDADRARSLALLGAHADCTKNDVFTAIAALDAITMLGDKAAPLSALLKTLPEKGALPNDRFSPYIPRLLEDLRGALK